MEKIYTNKKIIFLGTLVAAAVLVWYLVFYFEARKNLLLTVFDVGQGDAIFIEFPGGTQILIDGGPDEKILSKLGRTLPFWDRSLDLLILTHPHADHVTGLFEVLKRYDIGMVLESGVHHSIPEYDEWRRLIEEKKVKRIVAEAGQVIRIASEAYIRILAPRKSFAGESPKNVHDAMVVAKLYYGASSTLLTGDMEKIIEYQLLFFNPENLDSDVLKVGHHGSKTSTTKEFLQAVSPEVAIISAGRKNRYGHPHQEVINRLHDFGIKILRTDKTGDIRMTSNGMNFLYIRPTD